MSERLPLFPLATVLYPGLLMPLHIFEERYRTLVADLTGAAGPPERGSAAAFGVVAIREGRETRAASRGELFEVGCSAELRRVDPLPDGRFDVVTTGTERFRLLDIDSSGPYLIGEVEYLDEPEGDTAGVLASSVTRHYQAYRDLLLSAQGQAPRVRGKLPTDPVVLSYLVAAAMVLDLSDKQRLLEAPDGTSRLRAELALLRRERAMLTRLPSLPGAELTRQAISPN
jgi:Lon protease-like protein